MKWRKLGRADHDASPDTTAGTETDKMWDHSDRDRARMGLTSSGARVCPSTATGYARARSCVCLRASDVCVCVRGGGGGKSAGRREGSAGRWVESRLWREIL